MNVKSLEETIEKLYLKQKQLSEIIDRHEKVVGEKIDEIKSDIFVQNNNVMELAHIQQKDRDNELKDKEREVKQR